jgi:two-component system, chemotaxis family, chemotaxis protein CheY
MQTVLVADDAQFTRLRLGKALADHGYAVIEAADGVEAIDIYRSARPDVVLMNLTMPNKDGMAALAEICLFDPHARVILLSALGQQPIMIEAVRAGARDFLVKPCEPERVVLAVQRALEKMA